MVVRISCKNNFFDEINYIKKLFNKAIDYNYLFRKLLKFELNLSVKSQISNTNIL